MEIFYSNSLHCDDFAEFNKNIFLCISSSYKKKTVCFRTVNIFSVWHQRAISSWYFLSWIASTSTKIDIHTRRELLVAIIFVLCLFSFLVVGGSERPAFRCTYITHQTLSVNIQIRINSDNGSARKNCHNRCHICFALYLHLKSGPIVPFFLVS